MAHAVDRPARIGPNAIIRVAEAIEALEGPAAARAVFAAAGLAHHLDHPPEHMVSEDEVAALQLELRAALGLPAARAVCIDAGRRTGDYLLAHRIPHPAQWLLRALPAPLAARALAAAIGRHAWTFAGSGRFSYVPGNPFRLSIEACPLCRRIRADEPACAYYAATFERVFSVLASPRARVKEVTCQAAGAPACVFEAAW